MGEKILYKNAFCFVLFLTLFYLNHSTLAKKDGHRPDWNQIIPEIGKEFLPEESREKLEKIFPSPKQDLDEKNTKDNVRTYNGDKELSGKLTTAIKVLGDAKLKDVYTNYPITIAGKAEIKNSCVNHLTVKGVLNARKTTFKDLIAHDLVHLEECEIKKNSIVKGNLTVERSVFYGALEFAGSYADLKKTTMSDLKFSSFSDKKTLVLEESEIKGNIIFEGAPGEIIICINSDLM